MPEGRRDWGAIRGPLHLKYLSHSSIQHMNPSMVGRVRLIDQGLQINLGAYEVVWIILLDAFSQFENWPID